jgi:hypothetical protein
VKGVTVPWSRLDIDSGTAARDKHEARPEKFTGLRELRDAPGVENGSVLVGMLASGPVRREAIFVDDMKEVTHAAGLGRIIAGFQLQTCKGSPPKGREFVEVSGYGFVRRKVIVTSGSARE